MLLPVVSPGLNSFSPIGAFGMVGLPGLLFSQPKNKKIRLDKINFFAIIKKSLKLPELSTMLNWLAHNVCVYCVLGFQSCDLSPAQNEIKKTKLCSNCSPQHVINILLCVVPCRLVFKFHSFNYPH